jgi:hypothetical protein
MNSIAGMSSLQHIFQWFLGVFVVVIVWWLDLLLPLQSMPITAKVVSSNPVYGDVYSIQHYVIKFVSDLCRSVVFFGYLVFLLLKVALNIKNKTNQQLLCKLFVFSVFHSIYICSRS